MNCRQILPSATCVSFRPATIPAIFPGGFRRKGKTAVEYSVRDGVLKIEETKAVSNYIHVDIDFMGEVLSGGKEDETGVVLYLPEKKVLKKWT